MDEDVLDDSSTQKKYSEIFNEVLPYYLSIGMTYEQFWYGEADLVIFYRKAYEIKIDYDNQSMWLQGIYVYEAMGCALANAFSKEKVSYRDHPIPLTQKNIEEEKENEVKKAQAQAKAWMESLFNSYGNLGG